MVVVSAALHLSDTREFVTLAEHAGAWWMVLAVLLQSTTYVAQGEIWRRVAAAAGAPLRLADAFSLSLAKLFADQALPATLRVRGLSFWIPMIPGLWFSRRLT